MIVSFSEAAWDDYLHWQRVDGKMVKRINELIRDTARDPFAGIGKPEPLANDWSGWWSRRIDSEHRLVYCIEDGTMLIAQCRYHY